MVTDIDFLITFLKYNAWRINIKKFPNSSFFNIYISFNWRFNDHGHYVIGMIPGKEIEEINSRYASIPFILISMQLGSQLSICWTDSRSNGLFLLCSGSQLDDDVLVLSFTTINKNWKGKYFMLSLWKIEMF